MVKTDIFTFLVYFFLFVNVVFIDLFSQGEKTSTPTFVVTSPRQARFDATITFSVSVSNVVQPETIHLFLRPSEALETILNETTLQFSSNGVQKWSVIIASDRMSGYGENNVQLVAQLKGIVQTLPVQMLNTSGYIMIQTDKPIYSPRQTVMYRIIALGDDQQFAKWPLTVDIKSPDNVILERQHFKVEEAFIRRNFTLPPDPRLGSWTITASFQGSKVHTSGTFKFEVQEYVLPTFKAEVWVEEKVISKTMHWIKVKVKAEYFYGKPVEGNLELRLGVEHARMRRLHLSPTIHYGTLTNGEWSSYIRTDEVHRLFDWFPGNRERLFLQANVTEADTEMMQTAVSLNTIIASSYFSIGFARSKKYFKPGFNYTLAVDMTVANGDLGANVPVFVNTTMKATDGTDLPESKGEMLKTDEQGRLDHIFFVPSQAHELVFQVYGFNLKAHNHLPQLLEVKKFESATNIYIHLQREKNNIRIRYTPLSPSPQQHNDLITVLIVSKGRLLLAESVLRDGSGSTSLPLTHDLLLEAAPLARVLAYFSVGDGTEIVSDSMVIETGHICREELGLHLDKSASGLQYLSPKQTADLRISGGPGMRVGLLAVDNAVYFLRDEISLNREKIFAMLKNSDLGEGIGDGNETKEIFQRAGLQYMTVTEASFGPTTTPDVPPEGNISTAPSIENGTGSGWKEVDSIPLEEVRKYFPESWLFKDVTLSADGSLLENLAMPDSITTWAFTAVGVGAEGGVCMSHPVEVMVFKDVFIRVRLPYKAVRLEELRVKIDIYNYKLSDINVTVMASGDEGLCFSEEEDGGRWMTPYKTTLKAEQIHSKSLTVIPIVSGTVKMKVDFVSDHNLTYDSVEKVLEIVAEGQSRSKLITFPLDPTGTLLSSTQARRKRHHTYEYRTGNEFEVIRLKRNSQENMINLFLQEEVVQDSGRCQISSCGDLMCDIINTAVLQGRDLFEDSVIDGENAIGNLAAVVHAMLHLRQTPLMTPDLQAKGAVHLRYSINRLLRYRTPAFKTMAGYVNTQEALWVTWLTMLTLKTLCQAQPITFLDHQLILETFLWATAEIDRNTGLIYDYDKRSYGDLILSADGLIAIMECITLVNVTTSQQAKITRLEKTLKEKLQEMTDPLLVAKTAYALTLANPHDPITLQAVRQLTDMRRVSIEGLHYWSLTPENESYTEPIWYHKGTRSSTIEATAFALLVHLHQAEAGNKDLYNSVGPIAHWLIRNRNSRGVFTGAQDTAAAIQALARYRLDRHPHQEVNLHCHVTTRPSSEEFQSVIAFNKTNAIHPMIISDVPMSKRIYISTSGEGLGQMQVQVKYNIPVEVNADCGYNVTVTVKSMSYLPIYQGDSVCEHCNMGCDHGDGKSHGNTTSRHRRHGQVRWNALHMCIQVCVRARGNIDAGHTYVVIGMLTGFVPLQNDLKLLLEKRESNKLSSLPLWQEEKASVIMKVNQVSHVQATCLALRAKEEHDVGSRRPAIVTVRDCQEQEARCSYSYDPLKRNINLVKYCANNDSSNQGPCRCISSLCGNCGSRKKLTISTTEQLACGAKFIYKVRHTSVRIDHSHSNWIYTTAEILSKPKNDLKEDDQEIHMVATRNCPCPALAFGLSTDFYFFGSKRDILMNKDNNEKKIYFLDHTTTFLESNDHNNMCINFALQNKSCGN